MIEPEQRVATVYYNSYIAYNVALDFYRARMRYEVERTKIFPKAIYMPEQFSMLVGNEWFFFGQYERLFLGEDFLGYEYKGTEASFGFCLIAWNGGNGSDVDQIDPTKPSHSAYMLNPPWEAP